MLKRNQVQLLQIAVKAAGIRTKESANRYYLLLSQYKQPNGKPVTSSVQLNSRQLEDILAICEAQGFRSPGRPDNFYRSKVEGRGDIASFGQQGAIRHLAGDMGWTDKALAGFIGRMTGQKKTCAAELATWEANKIIEALKTILGRRDNKHYTSIDEIADNYKEQQDNECPLPTVEEMEMEATDGSFEEAGTGDRYC